MSALSIAFLQQFVGGGVQITDKDRDFTIDGTITKIEQDGVSINIHYQTVDEDGPHDLHYEVDPSRFTNGTGHGIFHSPIHHVTVTFTAPP